MGGNEEQKMWEKGSPIVTSPLISLSTQTTAPAAILALQHRGKKELYKTLN